MSKVWKYQWKRVYSLKDLVTLNSQQVKEEIKWKIRKYLTLDKNQGTTYQNLQYATKIVLKDKSVSVNVYTTVWGVLGGRSQISNLTFNLKTLEKIGGKIRAGKM